MKYLILISLLLFALPAYADKDESVTNTNTTIVNPGSSSNDTTIISGASPGSVAPAWGCATGTSLSFFFGGVTWTENDGLCQLVFQKREVCNDNPNGERCAELRRNVANWKPDAGYSVTESAAVE